MSAMGEMRFARCCTTAILAAAAALAAPAPMAQNAQHPTSAASERKLYRIAGALTDSVSGQPIAGATMNLDTPITHLSTQSTVTDENGQFSFDPVPQGKYGVIATRRGYITAAFDQHELWASAIVTGEGLDTEHIPFHLDPGGVIRGHVTDDAGEPVANAQVLVSILTRWGGYGERMASVAALNTDDQGEFEGWNLYPGKYVVAVQAAPWFAIHPTQSQLESASSDEQRAAEAALDVTYPVVYYEGTTEEKAATPISLASGESVEVNFSLHAVPAVHLTFRLSEGGDGGVRLPSLTQSPLGRELKSEVASFNNDASGTTRSLEYAIAPGSYQVVGGIPPHITQIDAAGNQEIDMGQGLPASESDIQIKMADGTLPPQDLQITLVSADSWQKKISASLDEKSIAHFNSIPQGKWIAYGMENTTEVEVVASYLGTKGKSGCLVDFTGQPTRMTMLLARGVT